MSTSLDTVSLSLESLSSSSRSILSVSAGSSHKMDNLERMVTSTDTRLDRMESLLIRMNKGDTKSRAELLSAGETSLKDLATRPDSLSHPTSLLAFRRERTMNWITALPIESNIDIVLGVTTSFDVSGALPTSDVSDSDTGKAQRWGNSSGNSDRTKATTISGLDFDNIGGSDSPKLLNPTRLTSSANVSVDIKAGKIFLGNPKVHVSVTRQEMDENLTVLTLDSRTEESLLQLSTEYSGIENNSRLSLDRISQRGSPHDNCTFHHCPDVFRCLGPQELWKWDHPHQRINSWLLDVLKSSGDAATLHRSYLTNPDIEYTEWSQLVTAHWFSDEASRVEFPDVSGTVHACDSQGTRSVWTESSAGILIDARFHRDMLLGWTTAKGDMRGGQGSIYESIRDHYKCSYCDAVIVDTGIYLSHLQRHFRELSFDCPRPGCTQHFRDKAELSDHLELHTKLNIEICAFYARNAYCSTGGNSPPFLLLLSFQSRMLI
jgi:hypothetical protein